eukprot:s6381_g1.t3
MAAAKSDSSTAPPVLQEGLHDRAQSPDLAEEEEVALDRSWTRVERPTAGEASEPETEAAGYGSLRARFSLRFRSFRRLAGLHEQGLPAGTADEKEASTEGQEDTFSPMKLLLYSLCFLAGATVPVLLVNIVKVLFRTVLEVGGWRACAITAMVALFVFPAPKRTPMKLAYPLAAGLGWFAAVFVSITPHICIAIVVPCGLAYGYFVHAEEESVSWWWTREDAVRILSVLENVREFNVVRAAVGSTAKVLMGGFAQMWLASKVLNVVGEVLRGGATRGLCTLSALSGMVAACFLHTWWLNTTSLAQAFDVPTSIALILGWFHWLVSKRSKRIVDGTKMGKTILLGHVLAMASLFIDSYYKVENWSRYLVSPDRCLVHHSLLRCAFSPSWPPVRPRRSFEYGGSQTSSHTRDPATGDFKRAASPCVGFHNLRS